MFCFLGELIDPTKDRLANWKGNDLWTAFILKKIITWAGKLNSDILCLLL